jgi:exodeoxyribonuclease V beta subunit
LQFPLVFVPFAGSFKTDSNSTTGKGDDESRNDELFEPSSVDEDMRLLYVALTRAQHGLWLGVAETFKGMSGSVSKKI